MADFLESKIERKLLRCAKSPNVLKMNQMGPIFFKLRHYIQLTDESVSDVKEGQNLVGGSVIDGYAQKVLILDETRLLAAHAHIEHARYAQRLHRRRATRVLLAAQIQVA